MFFCIFLQQFLPRHNLNSKFMQVFAHKVTENSWHAKSFSIQFFSLVLTSWLYWKWTENCVFPSLFISCKSFFMWKCTLIAKAFVKKFVEKTSFAKFMPSISRFFSRKAFCLRKFLPIMYSHTVNGSIIFLLTRKVICETWISTWKWLLSFFWSYHRACVWYLKASILLILFIPTWFTWHLIHLT